MPDVDAFAVAADRPQPHHAFIGLGPLRAGIRRRQDMGSQLDRDRHAAGGEPRPDTLGAPEPGIIEMRTYRIKPGMRAAFLEIFRTRSMPAHREIGMKILGPFLAIDDPDVFFFMRGFPDLESREPMKERFYEGPLWKQELEHELMPMIEKYDVVLVEAPGGLGEWR
jgi:hypothetical protein